MQAKQRGAVLVEINEVPSEQSSLCDFRVQGKAAEILPYIVKEVIDG
jgi:NAD-dependent SIR2 family protein deacetylase